MFGQRIYNCCSYRYLINHQSAAERENAMKQRKWLRLIIGFVLTTLVLNACSFSVQVFPTPISSPLVSTVPSVSSTATQTAVLPTAILASATPTLIPITAGTIGGLEIFSSVGEGELLRSVAFTPANTVL